jgi:hypothetical protein
VTVQDIAHEASTAVPTVYASTGGKAAILATLTEEAVRDPVPLEYSIAWLICAVTCSLEAVMDGCAR